VEYFFDKAFENKVSKDSVLCVTDNQYWDILNTGYAWSVKSDTEGVRSTNNTFLEKTLADLSSKNEESQN
jgi:hypothetical protein